ncbi:hypothetical protein N9C71_03330 [Candidatus Pelagibacter sp.]|nr:hypothetical protein [Candidatus Pelagibacter sp.]
MSHTFCTITSKSHNVFTLALISKIKSKVFILCLDNFSYVLFKKLNKNNVFLVKLDDLNIIYSLNKIYNNRNYLSFIFTLKPILIFYVLNKIKKKSFLIYLDSDIYFTGTPNKLLKNVTNSSIFLTKHNFSKKNIDKKRFGIFNAGFVAFCSDFYGKKYLKLWMIECIKCCDLNLAKNTWGDQMYLNRFNKKNNKIKFLDTEIFNLAPWNISNYSLSLKNNKLFCNGKEVIFYHFQDSMIINSKIIIMGLSNYYVNINPIIKKLYLNYFFIISKFLIKYNFKQKLWDLKIVKRLIKSLLKKDILYIKK